MPTIATVDPGAAQSRTLRVHGSVCDFHDPGPLSPLTADEFLLDTPRVRGFIAEVRGRIDAARSPQQACELIRPLFEFYRPGAGLVWRHTYDEQSGDARPFRSGCVNAACESGEDPV